MSSYFDFQLLPALLGLLLIPLAIVMRFMFGRARVGVIPYAAFWRRSENDAGTASVAVWWYLSVILLVIALAEPVRVTESTVNRSTGADVVIAIDVSTSMLAEDLSSESAPRDRLAVLKPALIEFIKSDSIGRVGLVLFAGRAYTLVPLSTDRSWLQSQIEALEIGDIEDGTAIGDGLGLAVTRFAIREPADRARMIMLLTDGSNTSGMMTPPQAAAIAKKLSIPIHSVAVGREGYVPYPVMDAEGRRIGSRQQPSSVDRGTLMMIATETGGSHQDAATGEQLELALRQISSRLAVVTKAEKILARHALSHWLMLAACMSLVCLLVQLHREGTWAGRQSTKILDGHVQRGRFRAGPVIAGLQRVPIFLIASLSGVLFALWMVPTGSADKNPPGRQVLIAMDVSRSMDIVDEPGASRADLASRLASRLLGELPTETAVGVLVFAGSAHLVAPIARERVLAERALNSFGSMHIPLQGSNYLDLLKAASAAFDLTNDDKVLVLLSDGEANPQDWAGSIRSLRTNGIRVVAVGFGEEKTSPVPDAAGGWLRDSRGLFVYTKPQPENLRRLATATGGVLIRSRENATLLRELLQGVVGETTSEARRSPDILSTADARHLLLSLVLVALLFAAWREVPARVRLTAFGSRSAQVIAASCLMIGLLSMPIVAQFARPLQTIQSAEERDALNEVNAVVRTILARKDVTAQDYRMLALVAVNYGAIHRLHAHPISEGVLRDGLVAVQRGRQLDPRGSDWHQLERQLQRLLEPPPPVVADDGEVDPANEPLEGKLAMDSGGVSEPVPVENPASADASVVDDVTSPGGGAADEFGAAEWRDASVAVPLYLLREVERGDSYAELFRRMQGRSGGREIVTAKPSQGW